MEEYTVAVKVEVDELYSVTASSEEEALQKFADGDYDDTDMSLSDNAMPIEDPRIV